MNFCSAIVALMLLSLTGCGGGTPSLSSSPPPSSDVTFGGKVQGDQQAIVGASVQLYAAGTTGNGSSPTPLLSSPITTNANGAFSVPMTYACPSPTSALYLIAEGGRPSSATSANPGLLLMAPVGPCSVTTTTDTLIVINEVTTVASAWALSPFLSLGGDVGASSTNAQGLANAIDTATNLVNLSIGTSPGAGVPSNVTISTSKLNSLANALTSCVGSADGSACGPLFSASTAGGVTPANTLDAAFNTVRNPAANIAAVYALATANTIFLPALSSAPPDWLLYSTITGGGLNTPTALAIDGSGNVWVSNYSSSVSEFSPMGSPTFASGLSGYGINQSRGMALDADSNVWISNEQTALNSGSGDITKLSSSGQSLSGSGGFSAGGIFFPIGIAADTNGNIWVADYGDANITVLNSSGVPLSGSGFGNGSVEFPVAIAIDANHNAWVGNQGVDFITKISPDGSKVSTVTCCDSAAGVAIDQNNNVWTANYSGASVSFLSNTISSAPTIDIFKGGGLDTPSSIAIDGAGTVWVTNYDGNTLSALAGASAAATGTFLSASGFGNDANLIEPYAVAIDASGNAWVSNAGNDTVTEFIGAATPVKTPLVGPPVLP